MLFVKIQESTVSLRNIQASWIQLLLVIPVTLCAAKIQARGRGWENGPVGTNLWCVVEDILTLGNPCTSKSDNIIVQVTRYICKI